MGTPQIIEGTGEELERYLKQEPKRRFRLIPLSEEGIAESISNGGPPQGGSLADLLGDYIGFVKGDGEANSENCGEKFADYLVQKRQEGRL